MNIIAKVYTVLNRQEELIWSFKCKTLLRLKVISAVFYTSEWRILNVLTAHLKTIAGKHIEINCLINHYKYTQFRHFTLNS